MAKSLREKLLDSENHVEEDMGDVHPLKRSDLEDALIDALNETLVSGDLRPIRFYVRKYGRELWPSDLVEAVIHHDFAAWVTVHGLTCELRRMMPRFEHSANWLLQNGFTPGNGGEFMYQ
jgi:hypothetical protein